MFLSRIVVVVVAVAVAVASDVASDVAVADEKLVVSSAVIFTRRVVLLVSFCNN